MIVAASWTIGIGLMVLLGWLRRRGAPGARRWHLTVVLLGGIAFALGWGPRGGLGEETPVVDVVVLDVSRSVGSDPQRLLDFDLWGDDADDRLLVLAAARRPRLLYDGAAEGFEAWRLRREVGPLIPEDLRNEARLDRALVWAADRLAPGSRVRMTLVSDGGADFERLAFAASRIPLRLENARYVPAPPSREENLALFRVGPAPRARAGARATVEMEVRGRVAVPRTVTARWGDGPATPFTFRPGQHSIRIVLELDRAPSASSWIDATLEGTEGFDAVRNDDRRRVPLLVEGGRPRVLRVGETLQAWGADLPDFADGLDEIQSPGQAGRRLATADLVVLEDLPWHLPGRSPSPDVRDFARALRSWVGGGGGLLLLGARRAFALGGWDGGPLDALSPVASRPPRSPRWIQVLLDRSGSMADGRFAAAAGAVRGLFSRIEDQDRLRVLLFGSDLEEATFRPGEEAALAEFLGKVHPSGGTRLGPALSAALEAQPPEGAESLVFLLTDAEDPTAWTAENRSRWRRLLAERHHDVFVFWFDRADRWRAPLLELVRNRDDHLIQVDDFGVLLQPFLEATQKDLLIAPATVAWEDGPVVRVPRLLRTRARDEARVEAVGSDGVPAWAEVMRGAGRVAAAPVDVGALATLFGGKERLVARLLALMPSRASGVRELSLRMGDDGLTWGIDDVPVDRGHLVLQLGETTFPLDAKGPKRYGAPAPEPLPPAGFGLVRTPSGEVRHRIVWSGSDGRDPRPAVADAASRWSEALGVLEAAPPRAGSSLLLGLLTLIAFLWHVVLRSLGR